jgi:hypothetical protein
MHVLPVKSVVVIGWHAAREDVVESMLEFVVKAVVGRVVEVVVEFPAGVIDSDGVVDEVRD